MISIIDVFRAWPEVDVALRYEQRSKVSLAFADEFERLNMSKDVLEQGVNNSLEDYAGESASTMPAEKVPPTSKAASQAAALSEIRRIFVDDDPSETVNLPPLQLAIIQTLENPALFAKHLEDNLSSLNAIDSFGRTALAWAAALNKPAVTELLLKAGADPSIADKNKKTALHWSIKSQSTKIAQLLLENGADVEACDNDGHTPLHEAAMIPGSEHLIELLIIKWQADVEAPDYVDEHTPLHLSAAHGRVENAAVLINHGKADLEAITKTQERTPLFIAITHNKEAMVRLLLSRGARIDCIDNTRQLVLHEAAKMGSVGVIEALRDYVVNLNEVEEGYDVQLEADMTDNSKRSPLIYFEWWRKYYLPYEKDKDRTESAFRDLIREVRELSSKKWSRRMEEAWLLVDMEQDAGNDEIDVNIAEVFV